MNEAAFAAALNAAGLLATETSESKGAMRVFMLLSNDGSQELGRLIFDAPAGAYRVGALRSGVSPSNRKVQTAMMRAYRAAVKGTK